MSDATRHRLLQLVRRPDADLAEAALLVCVEAEPDLDVEAALLRVDALADALRTRGFRPDTPERTARGLAGHLAGELGFRGDETSYHDPDNSLLTRVLDRRRGLPITLSILYTAVGRRLEAPMFPIALPGHVVTGVSTGGLPVVLDPFHGGRLLDEAALAERVTATTGGRHRFHRAMLRPAPAGQIVRRLLTNLVRDLGIAQRQVDACWASELRVMLHDRGPDDYLVHGGVLVRAGRFDAAARAFETYLEQADPDAPDRSEVRRRMLAARARMN